MIKAATITIGLSLVIALAPEARAQTSGKDTAINESVHRDAFRVELRQRLTEARAAHQRGDLAAAAKLYDQAWDLVVGIGSGVEMEKAQTQDGLAAVRLELARSCQRSGNLREALVHVNDVLRVDPKNEVAQALARDIKAELREKEGKVPSEEAQNSVPGITTEKKKAATAVQDGKLFYEMGKLDEADKKLKEAVKIDPQNQSAYYYLNLVREARFLEALNKRDVTSRKGLVDVEEAWSPSTKKDSLPVPNPYARTNLVHTSRGRQAIVSKLDRIHLDTVKYDGLPLSEVIINLNDEAKKRDPEKRGVNFLINPNIDSGGAAATTPGAIDPTTGLPAPAAPAEQVDMGAIAIKINPPMNDMRLSDVLDAIVKVAERPIKYSIEDYAVVFSLKGHDPAPLYFRTIKVDPNTFQQGMEGVTGFPFGDIQTSSGGGGGGSSSGSSGGGGQGGGGNGLTVPRVSLTGATGGGGGQQGGQVGGGGQGGGIRAVTRTNNMENVQIFVRNFFNNLGIDLAPPKTIFFNDREGTLLVRATLQDLDTIEMACQTLNLAPPEVNIKTKFVEVAQSDNRALGFDWYLGNWLMNNGAIVASGGTSPSLNGKPSAANPGGFFPGTSPGTVIPSANSDQLITSGLRNAINAPAVATITGILTDPQFRVVIRAMEQRQGVDLLNESSVTTLSGRQTEIQVVDLQTIVTGTAVQSGQGNTAPTGGNTVIQNTQPLNNYNTQILPFGPTLDVVPYVAADGFTVQMTIIPTITEFLQYDDPGQFVPQASVTGGGTLTAVLPLPHFRLRQVTTSAVVWDGQTVVLGGLITENVTKYKDKVPVLGDIPLVGRLFRSESSATSKRNLMIFVTPTIIDPAGNRFHSEDEMPFNQNTIPPQTPVVPAAQ
jgi:general secretion pathway protein D